MTTLIIQARDSDNKHLVCLKVDFNNEVDLKQALEGCIRFSSIKGHMTVEHNQIDFRLNGVQIQKGNANQDRMKYYEETGN